MTGKEFAAERVRRGYTQGTIAQLLGVSAPSVSRMESAQEVPAEHAQTLLNLPPATASVRGPYKAGKAAPAPRRATPAQPPRRAPTPPPLPATPVHAPAPEHLPEVVHKADEIGAVLLEGQDLARYWMRVTTLRQFILARRRLATGGTPCR
ncbi:MAG TPA: helix-turn-helix transcriptional regulator [Hyalangium sp.]|nr:helix-turn-helix transcriptional regulator [Hyalangium sp.]